MRILSIVNWLNRGGIEVQLLQAIPFLKRIGVDMDICTFAPGVLDADFATQGCAVKHIRKTPDCYAIARQFQRILAKKRYDVVHSNHGYSSGVFALAADRMGIPAVVSFHSAAPSSLCHWRTIPGLRQVRTLWLQWHRRLMERHARVFIGHSHVNIQAFAPHWRQQPDRYRVIPNGVLFPGQLPKQRQARRALGLDDDMLVLLHVGSFRAEKNHQGLLQIFHEVTRRRPDAVLVLVGCGYLRERVARQASHLGLDGKIRFAGLQEDVWPCYAAADVFVFPSIVEGFGNALVESQAAGLPLVASDIPALHESVAPSQHRFLFPLPRYDLAAEMVLEQAQAAEKNDNPWVEESEKYVRERFSIERFAADLIKLYTDVAA
jgi:glycosyltransferase EpsF